MIYALRANCHGERTSSLILDALAPAIDALAQEDCGYAVAYQPDWVGGPHLKVAVHGSQQNAAYDKIAKALQHHLDAYGAGPDTNPNEYEKTQRIFGKLTSDRLELRPNGAVEFGDFTPSRARESEDLGHLRDLFRSKTLELQYRLRRLWMQDHGDAIVELAMHLMALERIEWVDDINLWAMSILAHVEIHGHLFENEANAPILDQLEERLLMRLDEADFRDDGGLGEEMSVWVDTLQAQYNSHLCFWRDHEALIAAWGYKDGEEEPPIEVSQDRWREIATAPRRVIYRHMVNDVYDLQLTAGMTVAAKMLACYTIDRIVRRHMPETAQRIRDNSTKM